VSVSIGVVLWRGEAGVGYRQLAEIAAEVKRRAKAESGPAVIVNSVRLDPSATRRARVRSGSIHPVSLSDARRRIVTGTPRDAPPCRHGRRSIEAGSARVTSHRVVLDRLSHVLLARRFCWEAGSSTMPASLWPTRGILRAVTGSSRSRRSSRGGLQQPAVTILLAGLFARASSFCRGA